MFWKHFGFNGSSILNQFLISSSKNQVKVPKKSMEIVSNNSSPIFEQRFWFLDVQTPSLYCASDFSLSGHSGEL